MTTTDRAHIATVGAEDREARALGGAVPIVEGPQPLVSGVERSVRDAFAS